MRSMQGVLIADVIHSSRRKHLSALLADGLRRANRVHLQKKRIRVPYAVTAGDEFQTVVASIEMVSGIDFRSAPADAPAGSANRHRHRHRFKGACELR